MLVCVASFWYLIKCLFQILKFEFPFYMHMSSCQLLNLMIHYYYPLLWSIEHFLFVPLLLPNCIFLHPYYCSSLIMSSTPCSSNSHLCYFLCTKISSHPSNSLHPHILNVSHSINNSTTLPSTTSTTSLNLSFNLIA